jgi:glucosamine 6-phosphate synthetase-like amidotransferase/phosphosugar isomerase protein
MTDSQLITAILAAQIDKGLPLRDAIKHLVEHKLLGTYRLAILELENPNTLFLVKNSGDFCIGLN